MKALLVYKQIIPFHELWSTLHIFCNLSYNEFLKTSSHPFSTKSPLYEYFAFRIKRSALSFLLKIIRLQFQPSTFLNTKDQIHILNRLAGGAFGKVVDSAVHHQLGAY